MADDPRTRTPEIERGRRLTARDAMAAILVCAFILLLFEGPSIRRSGEEMDTGMWRTVVLAIGHPAGWLGDKLPLAEAADEVTEVVSPDEDIGGDSGFGEPVATGPQKGIPAVTPDYFDPVELGQNPPEQELKTLLVTGDSLAQPLDTELAKKLADADSDVRVIRDAHLGTGISRSQIADWGQLSTGHVEKHKPEAIVLFIGANDGFEMPGPDGKEVECCGADWAAIYANRARRMIETYRQGGKARIYWLTLPFPRDKDFQEVARAVNEAIAVAAQPFRSQARVLDMVELFTPGRKYRDSMDVDGEEKIVREADGVHLNADGARVAADVVLERIGRDFEY